MNTLLSYPFSLLGNSAFSSWKQRIPDRRLCPHLEINRLFTPCTETSEVRDQFLDQESCFYSEVGLLAPVVGHVGDGNFHSIILVNPEDSEEISKAKGISDSIVKHALACGGTCTGEHGVGYGKLGYLESEHGKNAVRVMHAIKQAMDPKDILNPGKLGSDINKITLS